MTRVFPATLNWVEHERYLTNSDLARALLGKQIVKYQIFLTGSRALLLLELHDASISLIEASTSLNKGDDAHNLTHVLATDQTGHVLETIPLGLEIDGVEGQRAESTNRAYMCCGKQCNTTWVTALKLSFRSTERIVRLSCWSQCKAYLDTSKTLKQGMLGGCGDPHVPQYNTFLFVPLFEGLSRWMGRRDSKVGSFLPTNFLGAVHHFGGYHVFDASGLEPIMRERISPGDVACIHWSIHRAHCARPCLSVGNPPHFVVVEDCTDTLRQGLGENTRPFFADVMAEKTGNDKVFFLLGGMDLDEFSASKSDELLSKELRNRAFLPPRKSFRYLCWSMDDVCSIAACVLGDEANGCGGNDRDRAPELSLRITLPGLPFGGMSPLLMQEFQTRFSSRLVLHTGSSLGYHLVGSPEGRLVFTLFGSASQLENDMEELERLQSTMTSSSRPPFHGGQEQYGVLRVTNPSARELAAFAGELRTICCDTRTNAIYSALHASGYGNASQPASLLEIRSILLSLTSPAQHETGWSWAAVCKIIRV